jgi:uncharacterized membrane protein YhhN
MHLILSPSHFLAFSLLTLVGVGALLSAEALGLAALKWIAKPLASSGFVAAALGAGALGGGYGRAVLVALAFSWIGDVLLIPKSQRFFLAGLVAFLLGHLAFGAAFLVRGVAVSWAAAALVGLVPAALLVGRWLLPSVPDSMRVPVLVYMAGITLMVALAAGTVGAQGRPLILAAAVAFFVSDLSVARDAFVAPGLVNRLWGLPLYYGAQLLFAATVREI